MTQIQNNKSLIRLIVITHRQLTPGQQTCQSIHSTIQYTFDFPSKSKEWFLNSNYLVALSVETEKDLIDLTEKLDQEGILFSRFNEPDLNDQLTSIAFLSSDKTKKYTHCLPLLLKQDKRKEKLNKIINKMEETTI